MNDREVLAATKPAFDILLEKLPRGKKKVEEARLKSRVLRYHWAVMGTSHLKAPKLVPSKFRLDLSLSHSAPVLGLTNVGADTRVRLEWKISSNNKANYLKKDQKIVRWLLKDVGHALNKTRTPKGFRLDTVAIGLGVSQKGLLNFSKIKGSTTGIMFFKVKNSKENTISEKTKEGLYSMDKGNEKILSYFKRSKLRKGIAKSLKISNWFSKRFSNRNAKWHINKFKASFSISYSGFLGLASTSGKSLVELYYKK
jgi:hypothetical protein